MDEATVELFVHPQVIERGFPVGVVEVRVASKHLPGDVLAIGQEALGEAAGLPNPVAAGESGERGVECRGACHDRGSGARRVHATGSVSGSDDGGGVGRKNSWVMNLAHDPFLNQTDVLTRWHLDRCLVVVEPGVCVTAKPG